MNRHDAIHAGDKVLVKATGEVVKVTSVCRTSGVYSDEVLVTLQTGYLVTVSEVAKVNEEDLAE